MLADTLEISSAQPAPVPLIREIVLGKSES